MGGVYDTENASRYVGMGATFILTGSDHSYMMAGADQRVSFFNGLTTAPTPSEPKAPEGKKRKKDK
jgi:hypothetical protein